MEVREKILESLEKRWAAADQDIFIAAVVLNPFLCGHCLSRRNVLLTPIGLCNLMKDIHLRIFGTAVDSKFQAAFMDYYNDCAEFSAACMALDGWLDTAKQEVSISTQLFKDIFIN